MLLLFCWLNNVTKTAWPIHSFSLPLCLPVISSVSIYFNFATAFTGKQSLSRPGGTASHSSEWVILSCQMHDNINYNWAINKTLEMTAHSLSCKQILKKKRHIFSYSNSPTSLICIFRWKIFLLKILKTTCDQNDFPKLCLEPVGHNFHVSVEVTGVVTYLHFEN